MTTCYDSYNPHNRKPWSPETEESYFQTGGHLDVIISCHRNLYHCQAYSKQDSHGDDQAETYQNKHWPWPTQNAPSVILFTRTYLQILRWNKLQLALDFNNPSALLRLNWLFFFVRIFVLCLTELVFVFLFVL